MDRAWESGRWGDLGVSALSWGRQTGDLDHLMAITRPASRQTEVQNILLATIVSGRDAVPLGGEALVG
jgi:hypothetical protein